MHLTKTQRAGNDFILEKAFPAPCSSSVCPICPSFFCIASQEHLLSVLRKEEVNKWYRHSNKPFICVFFSPSLVQILVKKKASAFEERVAIKMRRLIRTEEPCKYQILI